MKLCQDRNQEKVNFLEFSENENTIYPKLWYIMKAVLRVKIIALRAYIEKKGENVEFPCLQHDNTLKSPGKILRNNAQEE